MNTRNAQIERLRDIDAFSSCTTRQLKQIDSLTTNLRIQPGLVLAREGERALEFIVVLQGTATVSRVGLPIGRLGPGSLFGGSALVDRGERIESIIADTDMELLVASMNEFWTMFRSIPAVSQEVDAEGVKRFTAADAKECAPCVVDHATHGGPTRKSRQARWALWCGLRTPNGIEDRPVDCERNCRLRYCPQPGSPYYRRYDLRWGQGRRDCWRLQCFGPKARRGGHRLANQHREVSS